MRTCAYDLMILFLQLALMCPFIIFMSCLSLLVYIFITTD